ncbi:MAG: DUF4296 domain-containing protein [Bacteroidaceae bacterium]|nr:DUF4296 domain-containing protein [Bacteroidaceae bacterium]
MRFRLLFAPLFLLYACSPSRPSGILNEKKMTDVLVDYHLAQGMAETQGENIDVVRYKYIQAVFKKHRITEAEFDSSMVYWSGRAEEFTHIYENVVTRVQAQAERMGLEETANQDKFASLTNEGDTANIWLGKDFACVVANPVQCVYSFQMKADSTFRPGDSFIWRFKTQFVSRSMNNEAIALLSFYYETDTSTCVTDLLRNSPKNELRFYPGRGLDSLNLSSISGFIYLPMVNDADKPKPLLVSEIQLIRMHKEKPIIKETPVLVDTISIDTLPKEKSERLTPQQVRESQPRERKIHVTKENPNPIRPQKGIPQRTNRRRNR